MMGRNMQVVAGDTTEEVTGHRSSNMIFLASIFVSRSSSRSSAYLMLFLVLTLGVVFAAGETGAEETGAEETGDVMTAADMGESPKLCCPDPEP